MGISRHCRWVTPHPTRGQLPEDDCLVHHVTIIRWSRPCVQSMLYDISSFIHWSHLEVVGDVKFYRLAECMLRSTTRNTDPNYDPDYSSYNNPGWSSTGAVPWPGTKSRIIRHVMWLIYSIWVIIQGQQLSMLLGNWTQATYHMIERQLSSAFIIHSCTVVLTQPTHLRCINIDKYKKTIYFRNSCSRLKLNIPVKRAYVRSSREAHGIICHAVSVILIRQCY